MSIVTEHRLFKNVSASMRVPTRQRQRRHVSLVSGSSLRRGGEQGGRAVALRYRRPERPGQALILTSLKRTTICCSIPTWSSIDKEESLACQITSPFNNKLGCFSK